MSIQSLYNNIKNCTSVPDLIALEREDEESRMYGDSAKFQQLRKEAVLELSKTLEGMRNENPNNYQLIVEKAGALRMVMAKDTGTPNGEIFGFNREKHDTGGTGQYLHTPLIGNVYKKTNDKIKELIVDHLKFIKEKDHAYRVTIEDDQTCYSIKLVTQSKSAFSSFRKDLALLNLLSEPNSHNEYIDKIAISEVTFNYLYKYKKIIEVFKQLNKQPITHSQEKFYVFMGKINVKVDGDKWLPTSRHVVVIPCNDNGEITQENLADFSNHYAVNLFHTAHQDFKLHEKPMSLLFNKILNRETPKEDLEKLISEFEYRLHQLCYFIRGSAAANEMILESIRDTIYPEYILKGNLEALSQPYLSKYGQS